MNNILLIDDDPIVNFIHKRVIGKQFPDANIIVKENGQVALDFLHENVENDYLVFLDINMPVMNGWEFLEALDLPGNNFQLQIFILTSSIDQSDRKMAEESPRVSGFLTKPLSQEELLTEMSKYNYLAS